MTVSKLANGLGAQAARGSVKTLTGQLFKFMVQVLAIVLLARLVTPEQHGLYLMVASIAMLASIVGDFGLSFAAIQAEKLSRYEKNNLFWVNLAIGVLSGSLLFFLAPLIADFFGRAELVPIVHLMSLSFLANGFLVQFKVELSRGLRFGTLAIVDVAGQLVGLLAAVVVALGDGGAMALAVQFVAAQCWTVLHSAAAARWRPGLPNRRVSIRHFVRYGISTMAGGVVNYASSNADNIALGKLGSADALGVYGRMYQLFSLPAQQLTAPLTRVALPILARVQNDDQLFKRYLLTAQNLIAYVFFALFTYLIVVAEPFISIFLGSEWLIGANIFQVLAIGGVFQGLGYAYYWVFLSRARMDIQFRTALATRSVMVAMIVIAAPYGGVYVAAAVSLGLFINWLALAVIAMPAVSLPRFFLFSRSWRPIVAAVGYGAISQIVLDTALRNESDVLRLVFCGVVLVCWFAFLSVLGAYRNDYKDILRIAKLALRKAEDD